MTKFLVLILCPFLLLACEKKTEPQVIETTESSAAVETVISHSDLLNNILNLQDDAAKARYPYRNPKETLAFFQITPGMTVIEALPGEGWYSKILVSYLGNKGSLYGVDYEMSMWPLFDWANEGFINSRAAWPAKWAADAKTWGGDTGAATQGATFETLPDNINADAALFIRAMHNLSRFEDQGKFMSRALAKTHAALKSGGLLGIVQHQASEDKSNEWANGAHGYMKKSQVIAIVEAAGFTFVAESTINENPQDQPSDEDSVWRLSPSFSTSGDDAEKKAAYAKIGESNRMTLLFKKAEKVE